MTGQILKARRVWVSLSQADIAKAVGVSQNTVHYWETGATQEIPKKYWSELQALLASKEKELEQ